MTIHAAENNTAYTGSGKTLVIEGYGVQRSGKMHFLMDTAYTSCGKTLIVEGYGLQAVRNNHRNNPALAAEGCNFAHKQLFRNLYKNKA